MPHEKEIDRIVVYICYQTNVYVCLVEYENGILLYFFWSYFKKPKTKLFTRFVFDCEDVCGSELEKE